MPDWAGGVFGLVSGTDTGPPFNQGNHYPQMRSCFFEILAGSAWAIYEHHIMVEARTPKAIHAIKPSRNICAPPKPANKNFPLPVGFKRAAARRILCLAFLAQDKICILRLLAMLGPKGLGTQLFQLTGLASDGIGPRRNQ